MMKDSGVSIQKAEARDPKPESEVKKLERRKKRQA
jgi:hypothetical protein